MMVALLGGAEVDLTIPTTLDGGMLFLGVGFGTPSANFYGDIGQSIYLGEPFAAGSLSLGEALEILVSPKSKVY